MTAPSKADQEAEATARQAAGTNPGEGADALVTIEDGPALDPGAAPAAQSTEPEPQRAAPPVKSKFDDKRNDIVARFRSDRGLEADGNRDEISDFARSGMPPEFEPPAPVAEAEPEPAADPAAPDPIPDNPAAAPQKYKVKVRGQEQELTLEELTAKAQIALAADTYLDEAKTRLNEVDALFRETRNKATRASQEPQHPAAPNGTQSTEQPSTAAGDPQHPEDKMAKLVETMQFGDPEEAKTRLQDTIAGQVSEAVQSTLQRQRFQDEGARTAKVLKDFQDQHPDIAKDSKARAVIEADVVEQQLADIVALGIDPAKLRPDGLSPTSTDIANAHRWYRNQGFKVRPPQELLETGMKNYLEWKGVAAPKPAAPAAGAQPRVDVTVDRSARRAAIPQQPSRTVAPKQDARTQPTAQPRDRSSVVQAMANRRSLPRGKVVA